MQLTARNDESTAPFFIRPDDIVVDAKLTAEIQGPWVFGGEHVSAMFHQVTIAIFGMQHATDSVALGTGQALDMIHVLQDALISDNFLRR